MTVLDAQEIIAKRHAFKIEDVVEAICVALGQL